MIDENLEFAEMSPRGLHEKVLEIAKPYLPGSKILIAGAGQGSLEQSLLKNGVHAKDIQSVDLNPDQFKLADVAIRFCDLDGPLPFEDEVFDICFATEVIEHLHNPHNLIDEAYRVLKPDCFLFLTTPNVHSFTQKIRFLLTDKFRWFQEADYHCPGHICPIFDWFIERMVRNKFELIRYTSQTFQLQIVPYLFAIRVPFEHRFFATNNIYAYRKIKQAP